jgi:hypothetical protein
MQLKLIHHLAEGQKESLMHHLIGYCQILSQNLDLVDIKSMEDVYLFLQGRIEEFIKVNPTYIKPRGLVISYYKPSCCPASITISYKDHQIKLISHD